VFPTDRQRHWSQKRPDNKIDRPKNFKNLSRTAKANQLSRRRSESHFRVPNEQFSIGRTDCLSTLQTALADRTFLQVDQAALANKVILWYFNQRRQDTDMDSDQCLRACSNNPQGVETGTFTTRDASNSKHLTIRENLAKTSTYGKLQHY